MCMHYMHLRKFEKDIETNKKKKYFMDIIPLWKDNLSS